MEHPALHVATLAFLALALAPEAQAQGGLAGEARRFEVPSTGGRFANFETPQTHPIDVATVGERDYVLVCNTPDNSVEIYEAAPPHAFVQRVRVGMGPGTVRWNAALGRFYTCNFDGDSISIVRLDESGGTVTAVLERTTSWFVGDEPADIAFDPTGSFAAVTLSSRSSVAFLDPLTLWPADTTSRLTVDPGGSGLEAELAVKMPRAMAWLPDGRFFVANFRGGSPKPGVAAQYDLGLYRRDPALVPPDPDFVGGLGTTNHAFAPSPDGQLLFVVGTKAQNHAAVGVEAVRQLPTGFVQSWLMVVDVPPGGAMTVHPEAAAGGASSSPLPSINLNRDYSAAGLAEVPAAAALVQPSDVLVVPGEGQTISRIALTGFHSDRVALLRPDVDLPGGYEIQRVDVPLLGFGSYSVVGPRGLAYSAREHLLFVNGRLDNSLAVIDLRSGALTARLALQNDPTPLVIREGRQFLYSNRFSIDASHPVPRGGFVSCAACHVDGRGDGLSWDLGDFGSGPLQEGFHDPDPLGLDTVVGFMPSEKGPMTTQTLQGLLNFQVGEAFEFAFTNAPYHWRGDKPDFTDFNEAFVNLQGMADIGGPGDPKGISDEEMIAFRRFVNTILHPPNPEQHVYRITPGTLGEDPNDPDLASGAKLGLQIFHNVPVNNSRACVDCHSLPEGSSNTATLEFPVPQTLSGTGGWASHPFESAGIRNISSREMALHDDFGKTIAQITGNSGLLHSGNPIFLNSSSINTFLTTTLSPFMPDPSNPAQIQAVVEFVRQFDTGTAPAAGLTFWVDPTLVPIESGSNKNAFEIFEGQVAEANAGLAVYTRNAGVERGFWYDLTASPPAYREEGTSSLLTRAQVLELAQGQDSAVIAQATPLGAERRWASANGVASLATGPSPPSDLKLEAMAPNTAYVDVTLFDQNLLLNAMPFSSVWALRTLQQSVIGSFGVPKVRHEPPRRFRVSGEGIRVGARLLVGFAAGPEPASLPVQVMSLDLFPTDKLVDGRRIWETEAELDAHQTFALLNGGYWAPDVQAVLLRQTSSPSLQPAAWNHYLVGVQNEDGTLSFDPTSWQPLTIQDGR